MITTMRLPLFSGRAATFRVSATAAPGEMPPGTPSSFAASLSGTGTITDNDTATFSINNVTVNEADGTATFTVSLDKALDTDVDIDVRVTVPPGTFAVLATLLAAIGLYGMLGYSVARRTREFGLRSTLGAVPSRLRAMVLKQVALMALTGAAVGLAATLGLGRVLEGLLFGVSGYDPLAYVAAVGLVGVVAFAASYIPARRASNVAPMEALRYE